MTDSPALSPPHRPALSLPAPPDEDLPPGTLVPPFADADLALLMAFVPVPRGRARRDGWTGARQAAFLALLARIGSIPAAARAVGMRPRGLYRLLDAPDSDSFNRAFDTAMQLGRDSSRDAALNRAIDGEMVDVRWRGQVVGTQRVYNDRLLLAVLRGQARDGDTGFPGYAERREMRALIALMREIDRECADGADQACGAGRLQGALGA